MKDLNCESELQSLNVGMAEKLRRTSYGFDKTVNDIFGTSTDLFILNVSQTIPRKLWERFREFKLYDGECFNSALVESGILTLDDYSRYLNNVSYFLGMKSLKIQKKDSEFHISTHRPGDHLGLVKKRLAWEIKVRDRSLLKEAIAVQIRENFSPGSVLCINPGRFFKVSRAVKQIKSDSKNIVVKVAPGVSMDEYNEVKGGHCLAFITPNLVTESNTGLAHNLLSWSRAYDQYSTYAPDEETGEDAGYVSFYYFQIDENATLNLENTSTLFAATSEFSKLRTKVQEHRTFYESLVPKLESSQLDLYDLNRGSFDIRDKFLNYLRETQWKQLIGEQFKPYFQLQNSFDDNQGNDDIRNEYWEAFESDPAFNLWVDMYDRMGRLIFN